MRQPPFSYGYLNMPFPSSKKSHFQNEAKYKNFLLKTRFFFPENKKSFSYQWLYTWPRLRNSPYFCVFKCALTVKQNVLSEAEKGERDWKRCSAFARVKLLRNRLRKKPSVFQSTLSLAEATRKWPILVTNSQAWSLHAC